MDVTVAEKVIALISGIPFYVSIIAALILFAMILSALAKIAEFLAKVWDGVMSAIRWSVAAIKGGQDRREFINRRRQFLNVLLSDLSSIAKAEAWNDQYFTDLEAEVEIEGRYYENAFKRLFKAKSSGLRRAPSLIKAIDDSYEKCLLLTGDPGAGKSVALRHLASQMIRRSIKSKKEISVVPLYINLREMNVMPNESISVDAVREFVIDNVRRGDADTAEYVKANWEDFQRRGIWFFLFDSFDEIPAVLHAAASDEVVKNYGRAIQQFMSGLGGCRGVLASREYKSPQSLTWPKLKILPLSDEKKEELIGRTFLTKDQKTIAIRSVSISGSATYNNPLFLTLLCRYVKEKGAAPSNDHQLLFSHVKSLSRRDTSYVERKWGMSEEKILDGASEMSLLFATSLELGLAPTLDEIVIAAKSMGVFKSIDINMLVEALTYVKIGRTDVSSQDTAVRRFAFSHRRYQESLYAIYIARNIDSLNINELLTDMRWREYVVALLQIADLDVVNKIVEVALRFFEEKQKTIKINTRKFHGQEFSTFLWSDIGLEHVFSIFLEAKRYSPDGPWDPLSKPIEKIFSTLWSKGDFYDKRKILKYGALGSANQLAYRLDFSISSEIYHLEESAIDACRFALNPSQNLSSWIRRYVCSRIVTSLKRSDLLRWEAIAAQLPSPYGMNYPIVRARALSFDDQITKFFFLVFDKFDLALDRRLSPRALSGSQAGNKRVHRRVILMGVQAAYFIMIVCTIMVAILRDGLTAGEIPALLLFASVAAYSFRYLVRLICLDVPSVLKFSSVIKRAMSIFSELKDATFFLMPFLMVVSLPGIFAYLIFSYLEWFEGDEALGGLLTSFSLMAIVTLFSGVRLKNVYSRARDQAVKKIRLSEGLNFVSILGQASTSEEVSIMSELLSSKHFNRENSRIAVTYLSAIHRLKRKDGDSRGPSWVKSSDMSDINGSISSFLASMDSDEHDRS